MNVLNAKFDLSGLDCLVSEDAGKYLCNYSYYLALAKAKNTKVLFVHLPYIQELGNNSLENLAKDLLNIINKLTR